jgi:hypothetical protein
MVTSFYSELTQDEVVVTYRLIKFLRRLRAIGTLECRTIEVLPTLSPSLLPDFDHQWGNPKKYAIDKMNYSSSRNGQDIEDLLESMFGRPVTDRIRGIP